MAFTTKLASFEQSGMFCSFWNNFCSIWNSFCGRMLFFIRNIFWSFWNIFTKTFCSNKKYCNNKASFRTFECCSWSKVELLGFILSRLSAQCNAFNSWQDMQFDTRLQTICKQLVLLSKIHRPWRPKGFGLFLQSPSFFV